MNKKRRAFQQFKEEEKIRREKCEKDGLKYVPKKFSFTEQRLSNGETPSELLARSHFLPYKFPEAMEANAN